MMSLGWLAIRGSSLRTMNEAGLCPPAVCQIRWTIPSFSNGKGPNQPEKKPRISRAAAKSASCSSRTSGETRTRTGRGSQVSGPRSKRPAMKARDLIGDRVAKR